MASLLGTKTEDLQKSARSVFVGNIPYEATEEQLKEIFQQVGPVITFRIVYDRETGKPKGYGFCEYQDLETAQSAMRNLNDYDFHGRNLRVGHAAGETSNAEKAMSQAVTGPSEEPIYGSPIEPNKAPEAISKAVASLPPEQMFELMKQMKMCIQNNPNEARNMLLQNPQLAYALLQAQIVMKIVDPQVALAMLHRQSEQIPPLMPTSDDANKATGDATSNVPPVSQQSTSLLPPTSSMSQQSNQPMDIEPRRPPPPPQQAPLLSTPPSMGGNMPQPMGMNPNNAPPQMSMANNMPPTTGSNFGGPGGRVGGLLGDRPPRPGFDRGPGPGQAARPPAPFMDRGGPNPGGPGGFSGPPPGVGPMSGRADPRDPRSGRMPPNAPPAPGMQAPARPSGPVPGLPSGMNTSLLGARPGAPASGANITSQDQEKAQLIMQVLQLSDEQIALLPPDQRQSILILKEQIARSTNP